jgi:tetratricopeptide (TPR) repeat protein
LPFTQYSGTNNKELIPWGHFMNLAGMPLGSIPQSVSEQHVLSEAELVKGLRCLSWAQAAGFDPPELLVEAALCFQTSLKYCSSYIPALLGLAQLHLWVEDYPTAQDCLERIKEIDPAYPNLKQWFAFLLETPSDYDQEDNDNLPSESNIEWLYDETERRIDEAFLDFSRQASMRPSLDAFELAKQEKWVSDLEAIRAHVQNTLLVLDAEMDTSSLCLKLEPLDLFVQGLESVLRGSYVLFELRNQITQLSQSLNLLLDQAARSMSPLAMTELEFGLEDILDRSDRLQSQLQEASRRSWPVESLSQAFAKTQFQVEILQELLDSQR